MRGTADQSIAVVTLLWKCVFGRVALIPQPTTVGSATAKSPRLCVSFAALCGCKSVNNGMSWLHQASLKVYQGKKFYLLQKRAVDMSGSHFQGMLSITPLSCSLNFEMCRVPAWRRISVGFFPSMLLPELT